MRAMGVLLVTLCSAAFSAGINWDTTQLSETGSYCGLALDASGNPHVAYQFGDAPSTGVKYSYNDGTGWKTSVVDSIRTYMTTLGYWTAIAVNKGGSPYILYVRYGLARDTLCCAEKNGAAWKITNVEQLSFAARITTISGKCDSKGNLHIIYRVGWPIFHAVYDGSTWAKDTVFPVGSAGAPALIVDSNDKLHVAFGDRDSVMVADGPDWKRTTVERFKSPSDFPVCAAIDKNDKIFLSYRKLNPNASTWRAVIADNLSGTWKIGTIDSANVSVGHDRVTVACDANGTPVIALANLKGLNVYAKAGNDWLSTVVDSTVTAVFHYMAIDAAGNLHICYTGSVHYAKGSLSGSWVTRPYGFTVPSLKAAPGWERYMAGFSPYRNDRRVLFSVNGKIIPSTAANPQGVYVRRR